MLWLLMLTPQCRRTCHYEGIGFQDALISYGRDHFLNDTVSVGSVSTEGLYFYYTLSYAFPDRVPMPPVTIMGMRILPHGAY